VYDGNVDYVGATIHRLSKGLDSGDILFHAFPETAVVDSFQLGMRAVESAQQALVEKIKRGELLNITPKKQDRTKEIRYSVNADFTDEVARQYLANIPSPQDIYRQIQQRNSSKFVLN